MRYSKFCYFSLTVFCERLLVLAITVLVNFFIFECVKSETQYNQEEMKWSKKILILAVVLLLIAISLCDAGKRRIPSRLKHKVVPKPKIPKLKNQKQILYETRETSPPSFVTLLFFRLIYGLATSMGIEDRLPGFLAPPNADEADYGFFSLGDQAPSIFGGDDDYDLGL